jgi:HEXXH motif-containing protein
VPAGLTLDLDLDLDGSAWRAASTHGTGELSSLLDAMTLQWILRLGALRSHLAGLGVPEPHRRMLDAVLGALVALTPEAARRTVHDPMAVGWLARLWNAASGDDAVLGGHRPAEWFAHHLATATLVFLPLLPRLHEHHAPVLPVDLHGAGTAWPAGLAWRFAPGPALDRPVALVLGDHGVSVEMDGRPLCRVPLEHLAAGIGPVGIEVHDEARLAVVPRSFVLDGGVEVLPDECCPELSGRRTRHELRSSLPLAALDAELRGAFEILDEVMPHAVPELLLLFRALLPIEMPNDNWNSASTGEAPLVLQLTFRQGSWPFLLADSIVHETAHEKLDMALSLARLLDNDMEPRYHHPWRPDARPMVGVLLGAHAFLSVAQFYDRARRLRPDDDAVQHQCLQRREEVAEAVATLKEHALFTPVGTRVFGHMLDAFAPIGGA